MQLARDAGDAKIMLADESSLDEHAKKWLLEKKQQINNCRAMEAARAASVAAAEHAAMMQAEHAARMQAELAAQAKQDKLDEQDAWMAASAP